MNRAGEESSISYYRVERFFAVNDGWYFATREDEDQGPYASKSAAEFALSSYVQAHKDLGAFDTSPSGIVRKLEKGYEALCDLDLSSALSTLGGAADDLNLAFDAQANDPYTACDDVFRAVELLHMHGDTRVVNLPSLLKDYSHRSAMMPFPISGMMVPDRLYLKKAPDGVYCCKMSETGTMFVADARGKIAEEALGGIPLDARMPVSMLISRMSR